MDESARAKLEEIVIGIAKDSESYQDYALEVLGRFSNVGDITPFLDIDFYRAHWIDHAK